MTNYNLGVGDLHMRAKGGFYYLAHPYTAETEKQTDFLVQEALDIYAEFVTNGIYMYHATFATHAIAKRKRLPTHFQFWLSFNSAFIKPSAGVIVAEITDWEKSRGVKSEIEEARSLGKPVYGVYLHPVQRHLYIREIISARDPEA